MNRWGFRACRKDADDSEWRKLCGSLFQVVGAVKEKTKSLTLTVEGFGEDACFRQNPRIG